jgi:hypothetical protein
MHRMGEAADFGSVSRAREERRTGEGWPQMARTADSREADFWKTTRDLSPVGYGWSERRSGCKQ